MVWEEIVNKVSSHHRSNKHHRRNSLIALLLPHLITMISFGRRPRSRFFIISIAFIDERINTRVKNDFKFIDFNFATRNSENTCCIHVVLLNIIHHVFEYCRDRPFLSCNSIFQRYSEYWIIIEGVKWMWQSRGLNELLDRFFSSKTLRNPFTHSIFFSVDANGTLMTFGALLLISIFSVARLFTLIARNLNNPILWNHSIRLFTVNVITRERKYCR